jgi:hypothetical protein
MGPSWPLGGSVRVLAPWAPDIELPCGFLDRAPHHIPVVASKRKRRRTCTAATLKGWNWA